MTGRQKTMKFTNKPEANEFLKAVPNALPAPEVLFGGKPVAYALR